MLKLLWPLALLVSVASCANHTFHCRTPQRAINVPEAVEVR